MPIRIDDVSYTYQPGTPFAAAALDHIEITIHDGEFLGLIGHTGSGKSTLIQHLNGLLLPTEGRVLVDGVDTRVRATRREVRRKVGLVFQYPEHQLFEETVAKDVGFGPRNLGLPEDEVKERVEAALEMVGLDAAKYGPRSPFDLSGGEMRRVAVAGVLAMRPRYLVLDEPTAGLDPRGRDEILGQVARLHRELGLTVILVSHSMEDVARLVDRLVVLHRGKVAAQGTPRELFQRAEELQKLGLGIPQITEFMRRWGARHPGVRTDVITVEEAAEEILAHLRRRAHA
ncbi:energy-coupling factor transporter ATPase [Gelria sp. Kuro-4]|jgi:energy-coupling factor transport system ATP-binding protein|uniref:energy-coupling factor transporter ATPase n=1 Tax=Gelria sp. Kuro-4 TaxID=2796927 RepID=UPI001BEEE758|nr:energy-coupling factor transporter ATPase [Gelria sp. Kuro-4]MDI3522679.1 energy-coupling factor transport system ATP-binding protein [Bacillota bacterium]MDK2926779.1 energy-coupling factor transport system ATP-binding protein [Bacillota bacterium]BCV24308.1 energy-coupling factor transporter ATP-binding protein EcfA2 [Gelria sp. Kuro-4]